MAPQNDNVPATSPVVPISNGSNAWRTQGTFDPTEPRLRQIPAPPAPTTRAQQR